MNAHLPKRKVLQIDIAFSAQYGEDVCPWEEHTPPNTIYPAEATGFLFLCMDSNRRLSYI